MLLWKENMPDDHILRSICYKMYICKNRLMLNMLFCIVSMLVSPPMA